jgi:small subunit ribosomal protein S9
MPTKESSKTKYIEAIGRRKTATARVRITEDKNGSIVVNDKDSSEYFKTPELQKIIQNALLTTNLETTFNITAKVSGGGIHAQAEAIRLGISRALVSYDENLRGSLKKEGYLKRDPRSKERRKFGLKKARKAAQWSKR